MLCCASNVEPTTRVCFTHTIFFNDDSFWFSIRCLFRMEIYTPSYSLCSQWICICKYVVALYAIQQMVHYIHSRAYIQIEQPMCNSYSMLSRAKWIQPIFGWSNRWAFIHSTCKQIQYFSFPQNFYTCASTVDISWFECLLDSSVRSHRTNFDLESVANLLFFLFQ